MSRLTGGNVIKVALAVVLFPFLAYLLLLIGLRVKNKKVIIEGAVYAGLFSVALAVPEESTLYDLSAVLIVGSLGASIVRSYLLRDLWLHQRRLEPQQVTSTHHHASGQIQQPPPTAAFPARSSAVDDLSSSLAWVTSHAKQNKHRLPSEAYVTILETCHTLDAVIDSQRTQPIEDARFEYELEAMVRQYLPTVLQSYLAIPPIMVDDTQPNGRTPNEELTEQLGLLAGQADALHSSRHRQTSADLTSNGNFLRERFGHHQPGGFDFGIH